MLLYVAIVSLVGILVCLYGLFVERKLETNPNYKAACDISEHVSCTKPLLSPWNRKFGISNIQIGMIAYLCMFFLAVTGQAQLAFIVSCCFALVTIYLGYILFTQVKTMCLICTAVYIVNFLLLLFTYRAM